MIPTLRSKLRSLLCTGAVLAASALPLYAGHPTVSCQLPAMWVRGEPYVATLTLRAAADGSSIDAWMLTASAFTVDGSTIGTRDEGRLELAPDSEIQLRIPLERALPQGDSFDVAYGMERAQRVFALSTAPKTDFMDAAVTPNALLAEYWAVLQTDQGEMVAEFWPEVAPGHVRNFLDLCQSGFYDKLSFHRVIKGFMIQGGCPQGTGGGNGPRRLQAEFNDRKHVRGVLSAARTSDPNSASCQFFVVHAPAAHLDGQYTAFGTLVAGFATLEAIANTRVGAQDKPLVRQGIKRAFVIRAPADRAGWIESFEAASK